jgi:hypothetical protein
VCSSDLKRSDHWRTVDRNKWRFYAIDPKDGKELLLPYHGDPTYSLVEYIPVRSSYSIYNFDLAYWAIRLKTIKGFTPTETIALKLQKAICPICSQKITIFDFLTCKLEKSIINPKTQSTNKKRKSTFGTKKLDAVIHESCFVKI